MRLNEREDCTTGSFLINYPSLSLRIAFQIQNALPHPKNRLEAIVGYTTC